MQCHDDLSTRVQASFLFCPEYPEAGLEQLLEGGGEIFHKAPVGSQVENGESA